MTPSTTRRTGGPSRPAAFVVLNLYPYISGHMMVVPYLHTGEFDSTPKEITDEMMDLTKRAQAALREPIRRRVSMSA